MWEKTLLLLLLHSVDAVMASQCWQGATFSQAVVSPAVTSSGILRIPGVLTLPQCVAACCDLPGYNLAWLFQGRCYILICQQMENCQPRERPGADSFLAFLQRAPPQTLVLQSLVRGEPYSGRWRPLSRPSEAPGDLEALKDLALFDGPRQDFSGPGRLDVEYSEGSQEEKAGGGSEVVTSTHHSSLKGRDGFNQSEADDGPERTESSAAQIRASSVGNFSRGDEDGTRRPTDPAEKTTKTQGGTVSSSTTDSTHQDHSRTTAPPPTTAHWPSSTTTQTGRSPTPPLTKPEQHTLSTVSPGRTTDVVMTSAAVAPPTMPHPPAKTITSDPPTATSPLSTSPAPPTTTTLSADSVSEVVGSNRGPVAVVGPDRKLFLPLGSLLLDGSGSTDDHGIASYHWDAISGPPGLRLEEVDRAVATATGLRVGRYTFRLTVYDQQGAKDSASVTFRVEEGSRSSSSGRSRQRQPHVNSAQQLAHSARIRHRRRPDQGPVPLGQGQPESCCWEPGGGEEVELEMLVSVSQVSLSQRDTVVRQLAALLHVFDGDIQVRALQGHSHLSSVLRLSVWGPSGPLPGSRLVALLRNQLLRDKSDYLLFRVLRVDTVLCLLHCSGRGQCDPVTKDCTCDPFWTENVIRRYLGDGESNCEWRVLYVILTSFLLMGVILSVSWTFICCCKRRRQTKVRRKTKYTILDNMDEQERVELRPKFSIKHRSTEHNSSLMMSESELDSDQDTIFSRDRPVQSRNQLIAQANRNGNAFG
ncbi:dyslexia-associated protein KIAA0319 homolog isoform X2 [Hippoglossus stenolepis]|uniref:dyslexia-associated protein KIAA0319 homolog isoform X2 n=1 Tax=Hippoglossus stenolepis TaxID=195615 RepID=UPI001FAEAAF5|nr:dyslexia-associated protein KIAA0319 homolog isoform X2 [Hippoglossus stenolepis]